MTQENGIELFQSKELLVEKDTKPTIIQSIGDIVYLGPLYEEKKNGRINKIGGTLLGTNREINVWECPFCLNEAIIKKEIIPSLILLWICVPLCPEHEKNHRWNDEKCSGIEFYVNIINKNLGVYRNIPVIILSEEGSQYYHLIHELKIRKCDAFLSYYWGVPIPKPIIYGKIKHILDKL